MRRPILATLTGVALALSAGALAPSASAAPASTALSVRNTPVCPDAARGTVRCHSVLHEIVDTLGKPVTPDATSSPAGFKPADIQSAYKLPGVTSGSGRTVAIVDAYDHPYAENDLNVYRSQFSLPPCNSTSGGCSFKKVNQSGQPNNYPRANGGWAQEISLDLDMVSAACPSCNILLVEANSSSFTDLAAAVTTAKSLGAVAISNSYGGSELNNGSISDAYNLPGVAVTASTGDNGYGVESPASFSTVVGVGGTSLRTDSGTRGWAETAWSGAGSGCSTYGANLWQTGTGCGQKATADVSAVADPNTGVAIYDSYAYQGRKGWMVFGGTSVSSPIVASVYAMGTATGGSGYPGATTWSRWSGNRSVVNDVTSGSNGSCPSATSLWCTAGTGWDGPTGLGTPNGIAGF